MTKYVVYFQAGASASVEVEAEDPEAAREAAWEKWEESAPQLCAMCSGWDQGIGIDLGDFEQDETDLGVQEA